MSDTVISVENLGKRYIIGHQRSKDDGLRHTLEGAFRHPLTWLRNRNGQRQAGREEFWALENLSFEVKRGEAVGIIGRNGAGKSTLLKVLSRITEPTAGRFHIRGRVASLLEVGTGFHQELTGRENIFLNGSILGMPRNEIKRKFDEIVAFAEIERFLDTPVKRYSSGMYVRLAFSVAAHLDPDILIIDEVLAVGDSDFQKKCLSKMEEVAGSAGRTILFVSHNMGIITRLCARSLLLERGRLSAIGPTSEVVNRYLTSGAETSGTKVWAKSDPKQRSRLARPSELTVLTAAGDLSGHVSITDSFIVELRYEVYETVPMLRIAFRFFTSDGTLAFMGANNSSPGAASRPVPPGVYVCQCTIPGNFLNEGQYFVTVSADIPMQEVLFIEESAIAFTVEQTGGVGSRFSERWPGAVRPALEWATRPVVTPAIQLDGSDRLKLMSTESI